jgi:charged multivesicular body protein 2A
MGSLASKQLTPQERMKMYKREVDRAIRELDREKRKLEQQQKTLEGELKKAAKANQTVRALPSVS